MASQDEVSLTSVTCGHVVEDVPCNRRERRIFRCVFLPVVHKNSVLLHPVDRLGTFYCLAVGSLHHRTRPGVVAPVEVVEYMLLTDSWW